MAKGFSHKFSEGHKPSADRAKDVSNAAKDREEQLEAAELAKTKEEITNKLEARKAKLIKEIEAMKKGIGTEAWKKHTNMSVQDKFARALNFAAVEYGFSQKELVSLAVERLLKDLAKDSEFLKMQLI